MLKAAIQEVFSQLQIQIASLQITRCLLLIFYFTLLKGFLA